MASAEITADQMQVLNEQARAQAQKLRAALSKWPPTADTKAAAPKPQVKALASKKEAAIKKPELQKAVYVADAPASLPIGNYIQDLAKKFFTHLLLPLFHKIFGYEDYSEGFVDIPSDADAHALAAAQQYAAYLRARAAAISSKPAPKAVEPEQRFNMGKNGTVSIKFGTVAMNGKPLQAADISPAPAQSQLTHPRIRYTN